MSLAYYVLAHCGKALTIGEDIDGGTTRHGAVGWLKEPHEHVNAYVAPQHLDAIVQRATELLPAEECSDGKLF